LSVQALTHAHIATRLLQSSPLPLQSGIEFLIAGSTFEAALLSGPWAVDHHALTLQACEIAGEGDPHLGMRRAAVILEYAHYAPNWKPIHPAKVLPGFQGTGKETATQDSPQCWAAPEEPASLVADERRLGCGMHIRRKIEEALDAGDARAAVGIAYFRKLYKLEASYKQDGLDHHQRKKRREELSLPVLADFYEWVVETDESAVPKTPLKRALTYAINQREYFQRCFLDGRFEIDNGAVERELRRVRIGEKNFLFAGPDKGAERIAIVWTVVATSQLHGVDPSARYPPVRVEVMYPFPSPAGRHWESLS